MVTPHEPRQVAGEPLKEGNMQEEQTVSGEPKTLTTQVWAGRVEVLVDKEERVIHKISFELPPGFTFAEPTADGVPVVARDEAAELRAAAIEWWQAMRDYRYVPTADQEAQNQRLLAAENRLAGAVKDLAASEEES